MFYISTLLGLLIKEFFPSILTEPSVVIQNGIPTQIPNEVLYQLFVSQDNGKELSTSINIDGCVDQYHALARAEEEVLNSRFSQEYSFSIRNSGVILEPGDIIKLSSDILQTTENPIYIKIFSVKSNESGSVDVVGNSFHPGLLSWNQKENQALIGKVYIPFSVEGPTNLVFNYSNTDTKVSIGKLSWNISDNSSINEFYVDAVNTSTNEVNVLGYTKDNYFSVPPLVSGNYKFRVSGISISGRKSTPTEIIVNITDGTETSITYTVTDSLARTVNGITTNLNITITSTLPANCYYEIDVKESSKTAWVSLGQSFNSTFQYQNVTDQINYDIRIRIVHLYGKTGNYYNKQYFVLGKTAPPSNVVGFGSQQNNFGVVLSWSEVSDIDLSHYIIKKGTVWSSGEFIARTSEQYFLLNPLLAGSYTWMIKAVDTTGNESNTTATTSLTIAGPSPVNNITSSLVRNLLTISWTAGSSVFPITEYRIYSNSVLISSLKSTTFSLEPNWSGSKTFNIVAVDSAGQESIPVSHTFTVNLPAKVNNFRAQVIDNNILFYWDAIQGTLPTNGYRLRKGATLATSTIIGELNALFSTYFESRAGTYTYYIAAIDSAGNEGEYAAFTAVVNQPPDYELITDMYSIYDGTLINGVVDSSKLILPFNTGLTWNQHFTTYSKNTIQDFINSSYSIFIEPAIYTLSVDGSYEEIFDYGAVLGNTKVTLTVTGKALSGTPELNISIATSADGITFGAYQNTSQIFSTNFRAVKFKIEINNTNDKSIYEIDTINLVLDAKLKNDAGQNLAYSDSTATYSQSVNTITVNQNSHGRIVGDYADLQFTSGTSTSGYYKIDSITTNSFNVIATNSQTTSGSVDIDTNGTPIKLKQEFVDISSITVTPKSTTPVFGLYTLTDTPYQQYFTILIFDTTGTRVSGQASWAVKGY